MAIDLTQMSNDEFSRISSGHMTPSMAAEIAVPDREAVLREFEALENRIIYLTEDKLKYLRQRLSKLESKRVISSPYGFIDEKRLMLINMYDKLEKLNTIKMNALKGRFAALSGKLDALSPLSVLTRGYGAVYGNKGEVLTSASGVRKGDTVKVVMKDGEIKAQATEIVLEQR